MEEQQKEKIISVAGKNAKSLWTLTTKTFDLEKKLVKEENVLLSTSQISKIRIAHCYGENLYNFRHGKIIELQLNDAFITYQLKRPNFKGGQNV